VVFDRRAWATLDLPLRRGLLRRGVAELRGAVRDVDFEPLDAAARFSQTAAPGQSCEAAGGLRLRVERNRLVLAEAGQGQPAPGPQIDAAGRLGEGWRLEVQRLEVGEWDWNQVAGAATWEAYVDADRASAGLAARRRRSGERFQPLGLGGHSAKLADYMVNARVPAEWRAGWPVVACGGEVVWLAGLRLDERYRVRPETRAVLRLRFVPTSSPDRRTGYETAP
jgi:tRNA(Ile)-lysidine synthase